MKIAVQGSRTFSEYSVFMRAMAVAMSDLTEGETLTIYTVGGPGKTNSFVAGFSNLSEDGLRARGMGIKFYRVAQAWLYHNLDQVDYFVYLSSPKEPLSLLAKQADKRGVEVGIFRY
jgi:hypothetical protein